MEILSRHTAPGYHQRFFDQASTFSYRHRPHSCVSEGMVAYIPVTELTTRAEYADDRALHFARSEYSTASNASNTLANRAGSFSDNAPQYASQSPHSNASIVGQQQHSPASRQQQHPYSSLQTLPGPPEQASWQPLLKSESPPRAEQEQRTPRPSNAWIIYRSQKFRELQQERQSQAHSASTGKSRSQAVISRIISQMWQNETAAVKQGFEALAEAKKLEHQQMYPNYRYRPRKKAKAAGASKQYRSSSIAPSRKTVSPNSTSARVTGAAAFDQHYSESSFYANGHHPSGSPIRRQMEDAHTFADASGSASYPQREEFQRSYPQSSRRAAGEASSYHMYSRMPTSSQHASGVSSSRMHPYADRGAPPPQSLMGGPSTAFLQNNRYVHGHPAQAIGSGGEVWQDSASADGDSRSSSVYGGESSRSSAQGMHMTHPNASEHHHQHHQDQVQSQHLQQHQQHASAYPPHNHPGYASSAAPEHDSTLSPAGDAGYSVASRGPSIAAGRSYAQYSESSAAMPSGLPMATSPAADQPSESGAPRRSQMHFYY